MSPRPFVALSPGSRSSPLVLALARAAAAGEVDLLDVVDERAAAFVALGHARATGRAAFVVCTSGTAPAHWYPAVLEASEAQLPLVLLSADRPTELHHCGAPQTVDQLALFGARVRFFADLGDPQLSPRWLSGVRRTVAQAVERARGPVPGPVHLNVRARKPLEPAEGGAPDATAAMAEAVLDGLLGRGGARLTTPARALGEADAQRLGARLSSAERPLVVVGPLEPTADRARLLPLVERLGAPSFLESASQLRFGPRPEALALDALDLVLSSALGAALAEPDLIVLVGASPTSGALERYLERHPQAPRLVLGARAFSDPWGLAEEIVLGDAAETLAAIAPHLRPPARRHPWLEELAALDRRAWSAIEEVLASHPALPSEASVARAAVRAVPEGGALVVGNSLPIRLVDRWVRGGGPARRVISQRGVNGIDGLVSTTIGAHRALGVPTVALLGDLTTLHDVGALAAAPRAGTPLVLVVLRNGGGRIFEQLPIGQRPDLAFAMPHMVTETTGSLAGIARALGHRGLGVERASEVEGAIASALAGEGTTLVEVDVPPHGAWEMDAALAAALERGGAA